MKILPILCLSLCLAFVSQAAVINVSNYCGAKSSGSFQNSGGDEVIPS